MKHRSLLVATALAIFPRGAVAQGLPFHTESALTTAFEQRGVRFLSAVATRGDLTTVTSKFVFLPWAPSRRLTTRIVVPVVYKEMDAVTSDSYSRFGVGDLSVAAKWAFFTRDRFGGTTRLAIVASGTLPTGTTDAKMDAGGNEIRALRLGHGAVSGSLLMAGTLLRGRFGLTADVGHTVAGSDAGFRPGEVTRYDIALSFRFPRRIENIHTRTVQLYVEWNGSYSTRSDSPGGRESNSGGHIAFLSPGAQVVLLPQFLIEASVQIPIVQDLNGQQSRFGSRVATGARFLFF